MSEALTAGQLIKELSRLDPATVVSWHEYDSERDYSYLWSVDGVNADGELRYGDIIRSWDGTSEEDDNE